VAEGASVVYVGHATTVIEVDGVRLLTDPVLRSRVLHLRRHDAPARARHVDGVLVSHVDYDHLDRPSLRQLDGGLPVVAPRGARPLLRRFDDVRELDPGGEVVLGAVTIRATKAVHRARRAFVRGTPALGFVVEGTRRVYFAGDTDLFDEMSAIAGALDLALLPVAGWGRRVDAGHLDPLRAAQALLRLRPRVAVPIHWGTLTVPWRHRSVTEPVEFRRYAAEVAPSVEVRVLAPGEATAF
jgi:L-ascorbate metabolism protein UlaG (beta-lactamase superfamily)